MNKTEPKSKISQLILELIKISKNKESRIWAKNKILNNLLERKNKNTVKGKIKEIKMAKVFGDPIVLKEVNFEKSKGKINFPKI